MRTDFGSGSIRSQVLSLVMRNSARRVIDVWSLAPTLPWPYGVVDHAGRLQRKVAGTVFERVEIAGRRARVVRTPDSRSGRHILYFHGGAFVVGGWHLHGSLISRIAAATGTTVLAMDYRQLPQHSIDDATADGLAAYRHLLAQGVPAEDIVFMGDSAGGFLTFTVADRARDEGLPAPRALVVMSPLIDLDLERTPASGGCAIFDVRILSIFSRIAHRRSGSFHSPADCTLGAMPPVLLQVSSAEALYPQVCQFADQLESAGVSVELHVWPHQVHVFQASLLIPEAAEAIGALARYVTEAFQAKVRVSA
jgi:acetyl esterase/lipase